MKDDVGSGKHFMQVKDFGCNSQTVGGISPSAELGTVRKHGRGPSLLSPMAHLRHIIERHILHPLHRAHQPYAPSELPLWRPMARCDGRPAGDLRLKPLPEAKRHDLL